MLKSVTACSVLMLESCSQILENDRFLKKRARREKRGSAYEITSYHKKVVEILKSQNMMRSREESRRLERWRKKDGFIQ